MHAHELSLAVAGPDTFAAWHGGHGNESAIYLQALDQAAQPKGAPARISQPDFDAYEPDLIAVDGGLVVAWYGRDHAKGRLQAWMAGFDPSGTRQWLVPLQDGGKAKNPVVRRLGNALHVAWLAEDDAGAMRVMHRRFGLDGNPLAPPRQIARADSDTWNLNAAALGERFFVTYDAALDDGSDEVRLVTIDGDDAKAATLTPPDGLASLYPDLQFRPDGTAALTWFDERDGNQEVYLQLFALRDGELSPTSQPRRISHGPADSIGAYIAWNGPILGLAWSDEENGQRDIFAQTFDSSGKPLSPPRNLSDSAETSSVPAIRAYGEGFLVAWNDYVMSGGGGHTAVTSSTAHFALSGGSE
tara:strand:+ start:31271 stop:32344 length:1074 start_codon:yes stop_codon:yes gene_type:complete